MILLKKTITCIWSVTPELAGKVQFFQTIGMMKPELRYLVVSFEALRVPGGCLHLCRPDTIKGSVVDPAVEVLIGMGGIVSTVIPQANPADAITSTYEI